MAYGRQGPAKNITFGGVVQLNLSDSAVGQTLTASSSRLGVVRAVVQGQGRFKPRERWRLHTDAGYTGTTAHETGPSALLLPQQYDNLLDESPIALLLRPADTST